MSEKIFEKDVTYRAKVRVLAGTDEIVVRPEAQGKPAKKNVGATRRCIPPQAPGTPSGW